MATKCTKYCDLCNSDQNVSSLDVCTGRESDGLEMAKVFQSLDLCSHCACKHLQDLISAKCTFQESTTWIQNVTRKKHDSKAR